MDDHELFLERLHGLLPWADLHWIEQTLREGANARDVLVGLMWRLRGVRDGLQLRLLDAESSAQMDQIERAYAVCTTRLLALNDAGWAVVRVPDWPMRRKLRSATLSQNGAAKATKHRASPRQSRHRPARSRSNRDR